jgi:glycosyltransferase involved in cell wall biosynthesis
MSGARPHLLYVAWGFPPCRSGGVYRALATANAFVEAGWDVTVVTPEREAFERYTGTDETLESRIDPRVRVERVPFSWPALETDVRRYSWARVHFPFLWRRWVNQRDKQAFPERGYGPWRAVVELAAVRLHRVHPVDLVLVTANPHVAFTAAWKLHRTHKVPYVLDYRDAWLLDVFSGNRLAGPRSREAGWERRLVRNAAEVWFVNEPIRAWHAELYPAQADRLHVVANGFDTPYVRGAVDGSRPLTFGDIGTISPKVPLKAFVEGWRLAKARTAALAGAHAVLRGYLGYFHTPRADMLALVEEAAAEGISYGGPVGKADVHRTYDGFDVLLLLLGAGRFVTSGKVYEYLSTGLPIVSIHDPGNAVTDVLEGYPLWFPIARVEPTAIADALARAAEAARTQTTATRRACLEFADQYARANQLGPRVKALTALVAT